MARAASAPKKEISMEEALWKSADKLRGSVEPCAETSTHPNTSPSSSD